MFFLLYIVWVSFPLEKKSQISALSFKWNMRNIFLYIMQKVKNIVFKML